MKSNVIAPIAVASFYEKSQPFRLGFFIKDRADSGLKLPKIIILKRW